MGITIDVVNDGRDLVPYEPGSTGNVGGVTHIKC